MIGKSPLPGPGQAVDAGPADRLAPAGVLVVGGDVTDAGVQAHVVVVLADPFQLGPQHARVPDLLQVWPFGLHVPEQRLDPGLVGGAARATKVPGNTPGDVGLWVPSGPEHSLDEEHDHERD